MLSERLLTWYSVHGRDLPWRQTQDPYAIWVSEIMLQQTRVETVLPYYERFIRRFPAIRSLAEAPLEEVLKLWEGMGYYARARNLHKAARLLVEENAGQLPQTIPELRRLPGVGRYTADAMGAIAFGHDALAFEGNLRRVLTRLFDIHLDPKQPGVERELRRHGMSILPRGRAAEFNQALMDLGALVCTPRSPACAACPLAVDCLAFHNGTQEELPLRQPKEPLPLRHAVAAIVFENEHLLITRRPEEGLLGGLWGFPGGFMEEGESNHAALSRVVKEQLGLEVEIKRSLPPLTHTYTHFRTDLQPFTCQASAIGLREQADVRWIRAQELDGVPMGKLDRMLAEEIQRTLREHT